MGRKSEIVIDTSTRKADSLPGLPQIHLTYHADQRMKQFGVSKEEIVSAVKWGEEIKQEEGKTLYWLSDKAIRNARRESSRVRLKPDLGVVIRDGVILTILNYGDSDKFKRCRNPRNTVRRQRSRWARLRD